MFWFPGTESSCKSAGQNRICLLWSRCCRRLAAQVSQWRKPCSLHATLFDFAHVRGHLRCLRNVSEAGRVELAKYKRRWVA